MIAQKERVQIKVFAEREEHRLLRFAAVSSGVPMAEFIRRAAIRAANDELRNFVPTTLAKTTGAKRQKEER